MSAKFFCLATGGELAEDVTWLQERVIRSKYMDSDRSICPGFKELNVSQHVVIIGGGVIGLCTAWYAAERGLRVTIVERGGPMRSGCSFGNAGMIVPSHIVPLAAPGMVATALRMMWNRESPLYVKPHGSVDFLRWGYRFWRSATAKHVARSAPLLRDLHLASRALYEELAEACENTFGLVRNGRGKTLPLQNILLQPADDRFFGVPHNV